MAEQSALRTSTHLQVPPSKLHLLSEPSLAKPSHAVLTLSSIRISTADSTSPSDTLDNLLAATPLVVDLIEDKWENILSIGIKTSTSVLLPIWNSKLEGRFDVKEKSKPEGDVDMEASEGKAKKNKGKGKDKKRPAPDAEAEVEEVEVEKKSKASPVKPAKKAKAVEEPKAEKAETKKVAAGEKVKKSVKKSSSVGTGGAGKRSKEAILGKQK